MAIAYREVDCPECRGPGTARVDIDQRTNRPLGLHCSVCDLTIDYEATADPSAPPAPDHGAATAAPPAPLADRRDDDPPRPSSDFPIHRGAGWYELSNGQKVRTAPAAQRAQEALTGGGDA